MATTPATPAVVAPVRPAVTTPPPSAARPTGRLTISQQRLSQPLVLEQIVRDPTYDKFRTYTMVIAIVSVFLIFGTLMYVWGQGGVSSRPTPAPTVIYRSVPTPVPTPAPEKPRSVWELPSNK